MTSEETVLNQHVGRAGWILLNRPKALNALNGEMLTELTQTLHDWSNEDVVEFVVIEGQGRAFCAGGDIKMFWQAQSTGKPEIANAWLHNEYDLNLYIHKYPKPYISILDGITMGGGMGISIHGSHRIATQNTLMAMPETLIGFFPDVGARWFLNQAPGKVGLYLALTGLSIGPEDALFCGLATHFIDQENLDSLKHDLKGSGAHEIGQVLSRYNAVASATGHLAQQQVLIDELFAQNSIEGIFKALSEHTSQFARRTLEFLEKRSPLALRTTFEIMKNANNLSIEEIIEDDKRICMLFTNAPEFMEGIRAAVIDKDGAPHWPSEPISY